MNFQEAKRIIENRGYKLVKTNSADDIIKLRTAKRIAENASYKVIKENEQNMKTYKKLNEDFGDSEGSPLSKICQEYLSNDKISTIIAEKGLDETKAEILARARRVTGNYYKTFALKILRAKTEDAVCAVLTSTMFGGQNLNMAAGTRQSALHRNGR